MTRLHLSDLHNATDDRLTDELAAACWDSTPRAVAELRRDVARLLYEFFGPFDLCGEDNETLRGVTLEETLASVDAGPEGWIEVDGQRCCVQD